MTNTVHPACSQVSPGMARPSIPCVDQSAPVSAPKVEAGGLQDHVIRETVNQLRDIAIKYHAAGQLREQIAYVIVPLLKDRAPAANAGGLSQDAEAGTLADLDFEPDAHHAVADMANVGYALMQSIRSMLPGYSWCNSPVEVVSDLINERDEARAELKDERAATDRAAATSAAGLCLANDGREPDWAAYAAAEASVPDIMELVNRFLGWKLPQDFHPDAGISFDRAYAEKWGGYPQGYPIGTNLLTADQARAMFEYCLRPTAKGAAGQEGA